jgi:nucleoside-diphosphate-sugar epimerase
MVLEMSRVLITGASGFVGNALLLHLLSTKMPIKIVAVVRNNLKQFPKEVCVRKIKDITSHTDWSDAIRGSEVVIHLAARVHIMDDTHALPIREYRRINVDGTLNLARQAVAFGIKRFIFISSIKVNGELSCAGKPFAADDIPAPVDAYGISKMEAEHGLKQIAKSSGMEVVIIRPPLVYGAGVKANFSTMLKWLNLRLPLPLGAIYNRRSFVSLDNLVDLIATCIHHSAAANQTFLVSDGEDVSTTELLQRIGKMINRPAILIPVPPSWLLFFASVIGKGSIAQRLCGSLQVDIKKTRNLLGWSPIISLDQGLKKISEDSRK